MPNWVWVLLALVPFGALLTILYQQRHAKAEEKRQLRKDGSAAVTPVKELLARVGPESILWGANEEIENYLRETQAKWWEEVRPQLLVYANGHPSQAIREFTNKVVEAVQKDIGSTRFLFASRNTSDTMDEFNEAKQAHADSQRVVEELLQKIRDY